MTDDAVRTDRPTTVLLVEDSPSDAALLEALLTRPATGDGGTGAPFSLVVAATLGEACGRVAEVDCVLLDLSLPDSVGLHSVRTLTGTAPTVPVIVLTGADDDTTGISSVRLGAQDYLAKDDLAGTTLARAIRYAIARKRTESELRALTAQLAERTRALARTNEAIFSQSRSGMLQLDDGGMVVAANAAAAALLGSTADGVVGTPLSSHLPNAARSAMDAAVARVAATGRPHRTEIVLSGDAGGTRLVTFQLAQVVMTDADAPVVLVTADDVTEDRSLTIRRAHDQKLEELGRLAAGIAHEIRSPLQYVMTGIEFIEVAVADLAADRPMSTTAIADAVEAVTEVREGVERINEIVSGMNILAHRAPTVVGDQDLDDVLGFPLAVARGQAPAGTELVVERGAQGHARINLGRVQQAVLNLLVNAVHAIEDLDDRARRAGRIEVRTFSDDATVGVAVSDNGVGMTPETAARATEPFFTTKATGRGTGQGLALVREVVDEHGGSLDIESRHGMGSTITLRFPR